LYLALVLPISNCQEDKACFDEEVRRKFLNIITKNCSYTFLSGICYLLSLPKGFQNPARKPASR